MILRSPCRGIRLPRVHLVERPTLTPKNLDLLADKLGEDQAVFMWCGAVLGLWWVEAAWLTVSRLDLLGGTITVDQQLSRSAELVTPKSEAGKRTIACPAWLTNDLAALLARRRPTAADGNPSYS